MPHNLLAEYTVIHLKRDDDRVPPFTCLTSDQGRAEREAIAWAQATFGDGPYRVVAGEFVGKAQARRWGLAAT